MTKPDTISLRRRYLMIAGVTGAVTPVAVFAGQPGDAMVAELAASTGKGKLILSGRILGHDGKALSGAVVELLRAHSSGDAGATTDADGRFMLTTVAAERIDYRVIHDGNATPVRQLRFARVPGDHVARLQRDDEGTWRATFGLTLA